MDLSKATAAAAPSKGKSSSTLAKLKGVQLGVQLELDGWQYGLEIAPLQAAYDGHKAALVECCDLQLARAVREQAAELQVGRSDGSSQTSDSESVGCRLACQRPIGLHAGCADSAPLLPLAMTPHSCRWWSCT